MPSLETLRTTISHIEDLQAIVRTMKALALVNLRQYEKAKDSLADYYNTVELGLQALLHHRHFSETPLSPLVLTSPADPSGAVGVILFGSDHGLCGPFNDRLVTYALEQLHQRQISPHQCQVAAVGSRLIPHLALAQQPIQAQFALPSSLAGATELIQDLLGAIERWRFPRSTHLAPSPWEEESGLSPAGVKQVLLFYHRCRSAVAYEPCLQQILPLDGSWLTELEQRPWQSSALPLVGMAWEPLFSAAIRQYLLTGLHRATVESLASENAARLNAMQAAEKNIDERLANLNADYRQQRQNAITGELLDIVSGFEALRQEVPTDRSG